MLEAFRDVATFELACDHLLTDGPPAIPDPETVYLRNELHTEEFDLLCEAMADGDMPRIANRIADLVWVLLGTAVRFGIDLPDVWYEVPNDLDRSPRISGLELALRAIPKSLCRLEP
jgi:Phosphoribosyl-ATP pyrophosphohydrolase